MRLIQVPDGWLELDDATFEQCLRRASAPAVAVEALLDADQLAAMTNVPASWYGESARRGDIRHHRLGKYVRFKLSEVLEDSLQLRKDPIIDSATSRRK